MRFGFLAIVLLCGGYAGALALLGDTASVMLALSYCLASFSALGLWWLYGPWRAWVKWGWVCLSLVVIVGIFMGQLEHLEAGVTPAWQGLLAGVGTHA